VPVVVLIIAGLLLDRSLGEPSKFHPLVGFGRLANGIEKQLRGLIAVSPENGTALRLLGALGWLLLVTLPTALMAWLLSGLAFWLAMPLSVVVLYLCVGARSLEEHARAVAEPLYKSDLELARQRLGYIVSRETRQLDKRALIRGTVESVLENGSDALLAPLFWFALAGAPGVLLYRLANTLDAMWGYRNDRYRCFGWAAARMDDLLNWLPARLCAFSYALAGSLQPALRCWRSQGGLCDSPNGGPVMAAGAGALSVRLGGHARYHGRDVVKPELGEGREVDIVDIEGALRLLRRATWVWIAAVALIEYLLWLLR